MIELDPDDPDATVHERFDHAKANRAGSSTVQEGVEWHPLDRVNDQAWRKVNMHYHAGPMAETALMGFTTNSA